MTTLLLYWSPTVSTLADGWNVQGGDCSVSMEVPGDLAADVDLHTGDGHIDLDMPVTTEGRIHPSGIQGKLNSDGISLVIDTQTARSIWPRAERPVFAHCPYEYKTAGGLMSRALLILLAMGASALAQNSALDRPKITGIDHVDFYTTNADLNNHLYNVVLGLETADPVEPGQTQRYMVGTQWIGYSPDPDPKSINRMDHVAFRTDNCTALRAYLGAQGIRVPGSLSSLKDGSPSFQIKDPEGHVIEFVEVHRIQTQVGSPVSRRLIHAGVIVHDRAAEDHFYKDILGFHIYWYGGMKDGQTDWVAMQVPDGTDWLEYMLGIGPNADQHTTGVMDHVSLGVRDMKATQAKLESHGWKPHGNEKAQMGRDGKWQLNLYDPDFTRVELMEFKPVQKPCCSDFQGPQPTE